MKNKGITLVALVITVIVMIILAGVSLNVLLSENGLINKARSGVSKYQDESIRESINLAIITASENIEAKINREILKEQLDKQFGEESYNLDINEETGEITITYNEKEYKFSSNGISNNEDIVDEYVFKMLDYSAKLDSEEATLEYTATEKKDLLLMAINICSYDGTDPGQTLTVTGGTVSKEIENQITSENRSARIALKRITLNSGETLIASNKNTYNAFCGNTLILFESNIPFNALEESAMSKDTAEAKVEYSKSQKQEVMFFAINTCGESSNDAGQTVTVNGGEYLLDLEEFLSESRKLRIYARRVKLNAEEMLTISNKTTNSRYSTSLILLYK